MYMVTRGNSRIPLIKLSEGYSIIPDKDKYVTIVCGSNGERLRPIKVWDKPFTFFGREKLNAEFISKTELVYVKVTDKGKKWSIDIVRYKLPDYMVNNTDLEIEVVRKTKPITDIILHIDMDKKSDISVLDGFLYTVSDGAFKEAVKHAIYKINHKDNLCFIAGE